MIAVLFFMGMPACIFSEVSADVIFSVIISLGTFILGYIITGAISKQQKFKERRLIQQTIVEGLEGIQSHLRTYIGSVRKLANDIQSSDELNPQAFKCNRVSLSKFNEIPFDKLSDALLFHIKRNKQAEASRILFQYISDIEFLIEVQTLVKEHYNQYKDTFVAYMNQWNDLWPSFCKDIEGNFHRLSLTGGSAELVVYQDISSTLDDMTKKCHGNQIKLSVLQSFFATCRDILNRPTVTVYPSNLADTRVLFLKLQTIILQISVLQEYSQVFTNYVNSITDVQTELKCIKEFYQANETRWW
jgi:hypothetical protein